MKQLPAIKVAIELERLDREIKRLKDERDPLADQAKEFLKAGHAVATGQTEYFLQPSTDIECSSEILSDKRLTKQSRELLTSVDTKVLRKLREAGAINDDAWNAHTKTSTSFSLRHRPVKPAAKQPAKTELAKAA